MKKFPKIVPRNVDLSTLNRYSLAHFIVMGIDDKDKDPRHLTDKYMGDDIRSVSEYFESSSDSEDEAEEKEEGVRFASPRLSRTWYPRILRSPYHSHTLEHRYPDTFVADVPTICFDTTRRTEHVYNPV